MKRLLVGLMVAVLSNSTYAQIPVTDAAGLAQAVQQVAKAQKMIEEAKRRYEQVQDNFKENMDAIEGNDWSYIAGQMKNDYDFIPRENWEDIEDMDVTAMRDRYGLRSDDPEMQEVYDQRMRYLAANEAAYSSQKQHLENIEELRSRAASLQDPHQREELANAISLEVAAMQSDQNRIETINRNMDRDAKLREMSANRDLREMFQPVDE